MIAQRLGFVVAFSSHAAVSFESTQSFFAKKLGKDVSAVLCHDPSDDLSFVIEPFVLKYLIE